MLPCLTSSDWKGPSKQRAGLIVAETAFTKSNRTASRIRETEEASCLDANPSMAVEVKGAALRTRDNPRGYHLEEGKIGVANSLTSFEKDSMVVLTQDRNHLREHETEGETPALKERMGTGGNNVPMIPVIQGTNVDAAVSLDTDGYLRLTGARPRDEEGKPQLLPIGYRRFRRLTPKECERLQGWPDFYRMTGNGVTADVVREVIKKMIKVGCFAKRDLGGGGCR